MICQSSFVHTWPSILHIPPSSLTSLKFTRLSQLPQLSSVTISFFINVRIIFFYTTEFQPKYNPNSGSSELLFTSGKINKPFRASNGSVAVEENYEVPISRNNETLNLRWAGANPELKNQYPIPWNRTAWKKKNHIHTNLTTIPLKNHMNLSSIDSSTGDLLLQNTETPTIQKVVGGWVAKQRENLRVLVQDCVRLHIHISTVIYGKNTNQIQIKKYYREREREREITFVTLVSGSSQFTTSPINTRIRN